MKIHSGPINYSCPQPVNGYSISGIISEGRTFRVYKARFGTKFVILKAPVDSDTLSVEILKREYELCRTLSHPCIVSIIGFEDNSPVGPSIVMEYIEGSTLKEFVTQGATTSQKESVLKDILDGVDYLHHRGILHNDLKPDNIIINPNGAARIIDFGLSLSDDSIYRGCVGGSDGYSAPEILRGEEPRGAASDIYSIGLLIRQLFGGSRYNAIARKCSNPDYSKRYQSIGELRKAISRKKILAPIMVASVITAGVAIGIAFYSLRSAESARQKIEDINEDIPQKIIKEEIAREEKKEEKILSLEDIYRDKLSVRFNDAVRRMKKQKCRDKALLIEEEYFKYYLEFLDSIKKKHPMSSTGENSPEIVAACAVGQRQQVCMDSIQMSLPLEKEL